MFTGISLLLFTLEAFLPQLIPGGRLGLSQLVTLLVLYWFGWQEAAVVLIARVFLAALFSGGILNPVFVLSLGGGLAALMTMSLALSLLKSLSPLGVSVIGAFFHNLVQLWLAQQFFVRQASLWFLLPYFIWASLVAGLVIGGLAYFLGSRVERAIRSVPEAM